MLRKSAVSTQGELGERLNSVQEISERVQEAKREYQFLRALRTCSAGIAGTEGLPIVHQLAEHERSALSKVAEALQALYDHNERLQEQRLRSPLCA
jgi:hypothetical protein